MVEPALGITGWPEESLVHPQDFCSQDNQEGLEALATFFQVTATIKCFLVLGLFISLFFTTAQKKTKVIACWSLSGTEHFNMLFFLQIHIHVCSCQHLFVSCHSTSLHSEAPYIKKAQVQQNYRTISQQVRGKHSRYGPRIKLLTQCVQSPGFDL